MIARNDITGDSLISKSSNDAYRDGYDRIFGKVITVWENFVKQKDGSFKWEFNHIEDGWNEDQKFPTVKVPVVTQKLHFTSGQWRKSKEKI